MSTYVHGIAASENIDSSGERISIAGLDSSSLERDGVLNWEHKSDQPGQIVGKILKAKKIFQEADCEDEHQAYFWQKCQVPFLYILGELMDDYKESAKEVAGLFMYDADRKGKQESNVANFSIEGAKIEKKGIDITRSIARKVTITALPCNKAAVGEIVANPAAKQKNDIDSLFKTEEIHIEVFKYEAPKATPTQDMAKHAEILGIQPMNKSDKSPTAAPGLQAKAPAAPSDGTAKLPSPTRNPGKNIGKTKSGKDVMSHGMINEYHSFHAEDHRNAAILHGEAANHANAGKNWKLADHHNQKMKLHNQAAAGLERKNNRLSSAMKQRSDKAAASHLLGKSLTAGSGNAAPSQLTGGAALAKEDVLNKPLFDKVPGHKTTPGLKAGMGMSHMGQKVRHGKASETVYTAKDIAHKNLKRMRAQPKPNLGKSDVAIAPPPPPPPPTSGTINSKIGHPFGKSEWLARAEQEYERWGKKEEFRSFMQKRMPNLAKGEIDAIGQTIALKKALDAEKSLETMVGMEKALKFGTPEDQKAIADALEERKKNPPPKPEPKKKAPDIKAPMDGEVSHTSAFGKDHETVHLKSGHEVHGAKKGKFKAGDKVHVKPHLMGTVLIDHKK